MRMIGEGLGGYRLQTSGKNADAKSVCVRNFGNRKNGILFFYNHGLCTDTAVHNP